MPPTLSSLNAQLQAHGYARRPLDLSNLSEGEQVHVSTVVSELLGASVANLSALESLTARLRTQEYESERLGRQLAKAENTVSRLEYDASAARNSQAEAERRLRAEEDRTRALEHEIAKGRKAVEGLRTAALQEAKRAQLKYDKLASSTARSHPVCPPAFELLNPISPGASAPVPPGPLPLLEQSLTDLAALRDSWQEDTEAFRSVLLSTYNSLRNTLDAGAAPLLSHEFFSDPSLPRAPGVVLKAPRAAHPAIADAKLRALVAQLSAALRSSTARGKSARGGRGVQDEDEEERDAEAARAERERLARESELRDLVKDLEVQVAVARAAEEQVRRELEAVGRREPAPIASPSELEESRVRAELVRQKRALDAERERLRDQDTRLQEEKLALEAERAEAAARADALAAAEVELQTARDEIAAQLQSDSGPTSSTHPDRREEPLTPKRRHHAAPAAASPLREAHGAASSPRSPKRKPHVAGKRRAPLARLVMERQHRQSTEGRVPSGGGARLRVPSGAGPGPSASASGGGGASSIDTVTYRDKSASASSGAQPRAGPSKPFLKPRLPPPRRLPYQETEEGVLGEADMNAERAESGENWKEEPRREKEDAPRTEAKSRLLSGTAASLARSVGPGRRVR